MLTNEQKDFIRLLATLGLITLPVTVHGETITASGSVGQPTPDTGYYASGWKFNAGSPINAPRSKGCDELREALIADGHPLIAKLIPEYHVVRWWADEPSKSKSFGVSDLTRFAFPENYPLPPGVTGDHVNQAIDNIHELWNRQFTLEMVGFQAAKLYRGEAGRAGYSREEFAKKIAEATGASAGRFAVSLEAALADRVPPNLSIPATKFARTYKFDVNGTPTGLYDKAPVGEALPGHGVYDVWFDVDTDANVTRHWRSFARACGANVEV